MLLQSASGRASLFGEKEVVVTAAAGREGRWSGLARLMAVEYPHCTMHGVHVVDGVIVACEGIQRSFSFAAPRGEDAPAESAFDANWRALESLCAKLGSGRLAELKFVRGRPVSARTSEGGRRFKRVTGRTLTMS